MFYYIIYQYIKINQLQIEKSRIKSTKYSYTTLNNYIYITEFLLFIWNLWRFFINCVNINHLHLYIFRFYLCKFMIIILFSMFYISLVYLCKSSEFVRKAKANVSNFAFFGFGWPSESSKKQTRSKGLKMLFFIFPDFFPTPLFRPSVVSSQCSFFHLSTYTLFI